MSRRAKRASPTRWNESWELIITSMDSTCNSSGGKPRLLAKSANCKLVSIFTECAFSGTQMPADLQDRSSAADEWRGCTRAAVAFHDIPSHDHTVPLRNTPRVSDASRIFSVASDRNTYYVSADGP